MTAHPPPTNPLVGFWGLVSVTALAADGAVDAEVYGAHPVGYITYTADGHMMVMFSRGDRAPLSGNPTTPFALGAVPAAELAQAFTSFSAYAGTYTTDGTTGGGTVYHHLTTASIPNRVGTTLARTFSVNGDELTLRTPETLAGDRTVIFELLWHKACLLP